MTTRTNRPARAWTIEIAIDLIAITLLGGSGAVIGNAFQLPWVGFITGLAIWIAFRIGNDLMIISNMKYVVTERIGVLHKVRHEGANLLLLRGLIDKIPERGQGTIAYHKLDIYQGDEGAAIDFKDGTAPVTASVWLAVGNPDKKDGHSGASGELDKEILDWVYRFVDESRVTELIDGFARPRLQAMTIDEASAETGKAASISDALMNDNEGKVVRESLLELGVYLDPKRSFILSDIALPKELTEARQLRLINKARADADIETGRGLRGALNKIRGRKPSEGPDNRMGDEKAAEIFETRTAQAVIEKKPGDVTFIAEGVGGLARTLQVGQAGSRSKNRRQHDNQN